MHQPMKGVRVLEVAQWTYVPAAGAVLGWLFDKWRGTGTTGLLVGSLVGIAVGLWSMIRGALKLNRELERQSPTAGRGKPLVDEDDDDTDDWDNA